MMTSSPGFQFTGVATLCLAVSCMRIEDAQHFVEVAAGAHRVAEHQLDLLVRTDDEDGAHGGVVGGGAAFAGVAGFGGQHVVELGDFELRVADHRVIDLVALRFFDVLGPLAVAADRVHAQADDLGSCAFRIPAASPAM